MSGSIDTALLLFFVGFLSLLALLAVLLWRTGRTVSLQEQLLRDMAATAAAGDAGQDRLAAIVTEGHNRSLQTLQNQFAAAIDTLNRQLGQVSGTLNDQLSRSRGSIGVQLDSTREVIGQVRERLGELAESARHIHEVGRDIASLQDILLSPKLRGNLGEVFLEEVLRQVLPEGSFTLQHAFSSGERVDAVIRLGDGLVPVDAKFPLESFSRLGGAATEADRRREKRDFASSIRRRVDEIATRYIRPDEGTYDFALMFIPAENVFYEVIVSDDDTAAGSALLQHALSRHVIPVSPNSFYAYLVSVAYGLRGLRIEKEAREIRGRMGEISVSLERFREDFSLLGRHLDNARSKFSDADRRLSSLADTVRSLNAVDDSPGTDEAT